MLVAMPSRKFVAADDGLFGQLRQLRREGKKRKSRKRKGWRGEKGRMGGKREERGEGCRTYPYPCVQADLDSSKDGQQ